MGIRHLLNHVAEVWRPTEGVGALRAVERSWVKVSTMRAAVRRPTTLLADQGPGLSPAGERIIYAVPGWDIRPRDVVKITDGPDAPGLWEVDAPPTRPRGHHMEIRCRAFSGVLP